MRTTFYAFLFFSFFPYLLAAQGIRGSVFDQDGKPLAFATIYVEETGSGTTTNAEGVYEVSLSPGQYHLTYQFIGYAAQRKKVEVGKEFRDVTIQLVPQEFLLEEVEVNSDQEDPAYAVMRRAIAKAPYHQNQIDAYTAQVYIKGSGKLKDYPWIAKAALEKEGVRKDRVYLTESLSEIAFERPNNFTQTVIAIRSNGQDNNSSPQSYIMGSFYNPEIGSAVSPLAPRALAFYRFQYLGSMQEEGRLINKIKVIPRSSGEKLFRGELYIVEDDWSIHSLDLRVRNEGFALRLKQVYAPLKPHVWLPVSFQFSVEGSFFGFDIEYNYLASVSDYKLTLNPDLYVEELQVVDEVTEKALAKALDKQPTHTPSEDKPLQEGDKLTRKQLNQLIRDYEKAEKKRQEDPEIASRYNQLTDSVTHTTDSAYWQALRPIPLTQEEYKGYAIEDSISAKKRREAAGDTLNPSKSKGFQPWDLLIGDHYRLGERSRLKIHFPALGFNTVEGFYGAYQLSYSHRLSDSLSENKKQLLISPVLRYAAARQHFSGKLGTQYRSQHTLLELEGGRYVQQFNPDNPILPLVNTFTTLVLERNYIRLYEQDYLTLSGSQQLNSRYTLSAKLSFAERRQLFNTTDTRLVDRPSVSAYASNSPENIELANTAFPEHRATIAEFTLTASPWRRFNLRNGIKFPIESSSPTLALHYRKGIAGLANSVVDFDYAQLGIRHTFDLALGRSLGLNLQAGSFLQSNSLFFMDYAHFNGNQTPFTFGNPTDGFQLLNYYTYSTARHFISLNSYWQFRKLLLTQIPLIRLTGVNEQLIFNHLSTPSAPQYTELGYALDGIFRLFRFEALANFEDGRYKHFGLRIGLSADIPIRVSRE